jgi:Wax ester synthase-like Acyl-CoA acyltransferase domain
VFDPVAAIFKAPSDGSNTAPEWVTISRPASFLFWSTQLPRIAKPRTKIQTLRVLRRRQNSPDEHDRPSWLALGNRWEDAMDRLSALDASFLYGETPESPMHVAGLAIFEPPPADTEVFAAFRDHLKTRLTSYHSSNAGLDAHPARSSGLGTRRQSRPRLSLPACLHPKPGTLEQLETLVARLHIILLDRTRPLWQYYVIEGDWAAAASRSTSRCTTR